MSNKFRDKFGLSKYSENLQTLFTLKIIKNQVFHHFNSSPNSYKRNFRIRLMMMVRMMLIRIIEVIGM